MKKIFLACGLLVGLFSVLNAQQGEKKTVYNGQGFLGDKITQSGKLPVEQFKAFMNQPVYVKDSTGKEFRAYDYTFTYAERGLFQDSLGSPIVVTDYFSTTCPGGQMSQDWIQLFGDRVKPGDTAFIDQITVIDSSGKKPTIFVAAPLKIVLTK